MNRGAVLLRRTGLTQREIVARLARRGQVVCEQTVGFWRIGRMKPLPSRRRALALELGIPPAAWDWAPTYTPPPPEPWRDAWPVARLELRSALRVRLALTLLATP